MNNLEIDTTQLTRFSANFARYKHIIPTSAANGALRKSVKPMLNAARMAAPIGKSTTGTGAYRRGGATKKDLRIKSVAGKNGELGRVLVGVSKKRDGVGWRTHLITRGTKNRTTQGRTKTKSGTVKKRKNLGRTSKNDFLKRAYDQKINEATQFFGREVVPTIEKWIEKNIPPSIR